MSVLQKRSIGRVCQCALVLLLAAFPLAAQELTPDSDPAFAAWLAELRAEAVARGISEANVARAFSEITPPLRRIIANDRNQPETVQTYADYLDGRVSEWRIAKGRELLERRGELLGEVAGEYGVPPHLIAAIWGMETNYGTYPITEPLFNVLATLAYDNRRAALFRAQFLAALDMLESGFPPYDYLTSSWAGAMGQPQFLPENYLAHAVDQDGDGRRDIWRSEADVAGSIANYLKEFGWRDDQIWGRPVRLPAGDEQALAAAGETALSPAAHCTAYRNLGPWRDLQEWQALGLRREDGSDLPARSLPAALVAGDAGDGRGWLVYGNFCAIMGYNPAFKYAVSIGLLSDLIGADAE